MADTVATSAPVAVTEAQEPVAPQQAPDPKLAAYEKKERQLRQMYKQIQSEKAKNAEEARRWQTESERYKTEYIPKQEDLWGVLNEAGIDQTKLSEMLLNSPNSSQDPVIRALRQEIKAQNDKLAAFQANQESASRTQYEQALKQIGTDVKLLVDASPEFESIKQLNMQDAVVELIEQTFEKQGVVMDLADAAKAVENHLVEEGYRMSQLSKIKARNQPKAETPAAKVATPPLRTITNSTGNVPSSAKQNEKARVARAIAAFNGTLKG